MRCIVMEVNAAFMASYCFATRWQEGASAHDYDEGHYGANEGLQFTVFAACSGPLPPFRPGGPVRVVGGFKSASLAVIQEHRFSLFFARGGAKNKLEPSQVNM